MARQPHAVDAVTRASGALTRHTNRTDLAGPRRFRQCPASTRPSGPPRHAGLRPCASKLAEWRATVNQIALAWLLASSPVTLAIPGTGSLAHLEDNIDTGAISLTSEDLCDLA